MEKSKYKIEDAAHLEDVIVSWIITHKCQEQCGYCISPSCSQEISSEEEHFALQDQMIKTGLTKMRYIGGEPLLVPHLPELVIDASKKGLNTRISTNGRALTEEMMQELNGYINSFAFPYESTNDQLNAEIRKSKNHRQIVESRIKMVKDCNPDIGVLVNTCVHKKNIKELKKSAEILSTLGVDHWKLRRFYSASGRGAVPNKEQFELTDEEFFNIVEQLQREFPDLKIDGRMPSKIETRLMLSPQGELYRMVGDKTISYGQLLEDDLNIAEIYQNEHCN